jgi:hypothetical protein
MRFCDPSTHEFGDSDQHRAYLTRLCCAFRLSQPLDALFRPPPFRPCLVPVAPLGFCLQRLSLSRSPVGVTTARSLHAVSSFVLDRSPSRDDRSSKGLSIGRVRLRQGGFTRNPGGRSSPGLPSPRCFPGDLGLVLPRSLLSWAFAFRRTVARPSSC